MRANQRTVALVAGICTVMVSTAIFAQDPPGRHEIQRLDVPGAPDKQIVVELNEFKPGDGAGTSFPSRDRARLCHSGRHGAAAGQRSDHVSDRRAAVEHARRRPRWLQGCRGHVFEGILGLRRRPQQAVSRAIAQ
jgi:hypothetical protein